MLSATRKLYFRKKLSVVEFYLSNEISYQDLAIREGITNPSIIALWVSRFRAAGPDALRAHKKGQKKTLDTPMIDAPIQKKEKLMILVLNM